MVNRSAQAVIDLQALKNNLAVLRRRLSPNSKIMAVIKADGYGHGLLPIGRSAVGSGADWLGVVSLEDALQLRQAGLRQPVLLMAGGSLEEALEAARHDIQFTVVDTAWLEPLHRSLQTHGLRLKTHIKFDTGMHRLGLMNESLPVVLENLPKMPAFEWVGCCSHLANSDDPRDDFAEQQLQKLKQMAQTCQNAAGGRLVQHIGNSGAIFRNNAFHLDLVRPGIALYGFAQGDGAENLQPVMSLTAPLLQIKAIGIGESVGYDRAFIAKRPTTVGVLPLGYADGFSRAYAGSYGLVHGHPAAILGRVCMDMLMIDLSDCLTKTKVNLGDVVTFFGVPGAPSAYDLARRSGTTHYQVLTSIHPRVKRLYKGG